MNDRLKELIKQHDVDFTIDGTGYGEGNIESLAELIVQECISQIGEFTGEKDATEIVLADGTRGLTYDTVTAEEVLRNHFGLK